MGGKSLIESVGKLMSIKCIALIAGKKSHIPN